MGVIIIDKAMILYVLKKELFQKIGNCKYGKIKKIIICATWYIYVK